MAEATNQVSDYFLRYGLQRDPFAAAADEEFYFETPALSQRLDLLLHLIEFSHETVMVLGEKGIGKTAMLDQVRARAPAHWRVCRVAADPMRDALGLLSAIAEGFGLPLASSADTAQATEAVQAHLRASEQSMLIPAVLVDDAHELPVDALALLMDLAQSEQDRVRLRLVLFCEPQITSMLVNPKLRRFKQGIMHTLDIPALSDEQALEYLEARMEYAGLEGEGPFNANLAGRLNRTAEGRPGRLNALARQALIGGDLPTEKKPAQRAPARPGRVQRRHVIVAALLLAGSVVLAVLIREPEHAMREAAQPEIVPLELPTEKAPVVNTMPASPPPAPKAEAQAEAPPAEPAPQPAATQPPEHRAPPPTGQTQATPPEPTPVKIAAKPAEPAPQPVAAQPPEHKAPPPAEQTQAAPSAPAKPATEAAKPAPKAVVEKPAPAHKTTPPSKPAQSADAAWLRAQPPHHYVLQLYASQDTESVKKFLHDYHLMGKTRIVATRHNGKRWYVVLYGSYRDRAAAARASATLPPRIQQLKPWPRTIAAVSHVLEKKP